MPSSAATPAGVVNVLAGAAGALPVLGRAVVIELHSDADDVIALLLEQGRDDRGIDAARHGHDHAAPSGGSRQVETVERLGTSIHHSGIPRNIFGAPRATATRAPGFLQ